MNPAYIPTGTPVPNSAGDYLTPSGVPVDQNGRILIPELTQRSPTHNESVMLAGDEVAMASTNVSDIWFRWGHGEVYDPKLFTRFLDGSLYVYHGPPVSLSVAVAMVETSSPGRFVWNVLRILYPVPSAYGSGPGRYECLVKGTKKKPKPQIVRLVR